MTTSPRTRAERNESGVALVVAVCVTFIVLLLSMTAISQSIDSANQSGISNRQVQSVDTAEGALQLEYNAITIASAAGRTTLACPSNPPSIAVGSGTATLAAVVASNSYCTGAIPANQSIPLNSGSIVLTAVGSSAVTGFGQLRTISATMTGSPQTTYPFLIFGQSSLTFNGKTNTVGSYSETAPVSATNPNPTGAVSVGTLGTCSGRLPSNVTVEAASGCTATGTTTYTYTVPVAPAVYSPCPATSGVITSPLAGGTYLCTTTVSINANLTLSGASDANPVKIYIILPAASISNDALDIAAGVTVNATAALPDAQAFQIFSNSSGGVGGNNGNGYSFGGIVDAPDATLTGNGCKSTYYGALVVGTYTCNGGPNLNVYYDSSLTSLTSLASWKVSKYVGVAAG